MLGFEKLLHATAENIEDPRLAGAVNTSTLNVAMVFGTKSWSKLHTVGLRCFDATLEGLRDFSMRHTHCLRFLLLENSNLLAGIWKICSGLWLEMPELKVEAG